MSSGLYFDYCATTPVHPEVRQAMLSALGEDYGNPSSMHRFGRRARSMVEQAREQVAEAFRAKSEEILFTSGATESTNLALRGLMHASSPKKTHLIISAVEHHATLHTAQALASEGFDLTILPVDRHGVVSLEDVREALRPDTALVSVMMVNNEVGSVQDAAGIGKLAHEAGALFHTDAVQAANYYNLDMDSLRADLASISAHKIYGPKGVGALYVRSGVHLKPVLAGGAQERKLRPGTENVPGIVGLGMAVQMRNAYEARFDHMSMLRNVLAEGLQERIPGCVINSPESGAPHVLSVSFSGTDGEMLLFYLDRAGVAVSMGSACTAESIEPSHVLTAMGMPLDQIEGTLRISMGEPTTPEEIEALLDILPETVEKAGVQH